MNNDRKWELHDDMEGMTPMQRHEYTQSLPADEQVDWVCGSPPKTHAEIRAETADHITHTLLFVLVAVMLTTCALT